MDDSGSFGDSWCDLCGHSCGFSECVPAVSSGVPVVTDVSVSPSPVGELGEVSLPFLSPESVEPSIWKGNEI